jgi:PAS domain S-box-containing protein
MKFLDVLRLPGLKILDRAACPVAAQDLDGRIVYVNPAFCRTFDIPAEIAVGHFGAAQFPEAERSRYVDAMREWSQGVARPARLTVRLRDGRTHPFLILPQPIADDAGAIAGTLLLIMDPEPFAEAAADRIQNTGSLVRAVLRTISDELDQALGRSSEVQLDLEDLRRRVPALKALTRREWAVASRIGRGDRTSLVAKDLGISTNTVRNHLKAIFRKTGIGSQVALVERFKQWRERAAPRGPGRGA